MGRMRPLLQTVNPRSAFDSSLVSPTRAAPFPRKVLQPADSDEAASLDRPRRARWGWLLNHGADQVPKCAGYPKSRPLLDLPSDQHHDAFVRTTLTLEDDVARLIEEEAHRQRKPIKHVVNEALRRGLTARVNDRPRKRYRVRPHVTTLRPGIDVESLNKLAGEFEDEAFAEKARTRR